MFTLRKFVAPEFIFGVGAIDMTAQYLKKYGAKKVFLATDSGVIAAGWARKITEQLDLAGIEYLLYDNISPNPRDTEVMEGADLYLASGCNVLLALGGGSVIDCAKGIGIVASNGGYILDFEGVDNVDKPIPALICIPTTGGTSADVSQFSIILNQAEKVKIAIISKAVVPDLALIDPRLLTTMDSFLTASTGLDALVHAIEAFVSNANSPITDLHALEAIRLIGRNLIPSYNEPDNIELRTNMMLASLEAGLAFSNASLGAVHAMAHSLGGFLDLQHGLCNSILLDHVVNFNFESSTDKYAIIATNLGIDIRGMTPKVTQKALNEKINGMKAEMGIYEKLGDLGVKSADLHTLALKAREDPCLVTNPREANVRDIEVIYEEAI